VSPEQAYVTAVSTMRALAIPDIVHYRSVWTSTGGGFTIVQDGTHIAIAGGIGRAYHQAATYDVTFESSSRMITVTTPTDHLRGTGSRLLDPTWTGAYDILRYGLHGEPVADTPSPAPLAASTPAPDVATIASVVAISPAYYHVTDAGTGACPNGDAGRVLALRPYGDAHAHPLTAVTIDARNDRFCSMRFDLNATGVLGVTGDYEIDFTDAGAYWLVSGGFADISARVMGIAAKHVVLRWANTHDAVTPK
jgi:hypothetical protein